MGSKRKRQAAEAATTAPAAKKQAKESKTKKPDPEAPIAVAVEETNEAPAVAPPAPPFTDNPRGPELKREVSLYSQLSSEDATERLHAATAVVSGLLGGSGVSEPTLLRHLERRLFRGLASGRKGARLGFSVVLAEVLGQLFGGGEERYAGLGFERVLEILRVKTKPEGDLSGQEEKDHALGLLFGLQAFVRARILFKGEGRWEAVLEALLELCARKPWLREEVGWVVVEGLGQMGQGQAEETLQRLVEAGLAATPEGVGIWISARRLFPDMKFPGKPWGNSGNPLEHLKALGKALKESSSPEVEGQAKATGNWNPQLHFVWGLIVDQYVAGARAGEDGVAEEFEKFWKVAVDGKAYSYAIYRIIC
jgi:DNA polymerase phi